jgi:hypothetical protein
MAKTELIVSPVSHQQCEKVACNKKPVKSGEQDSARDSSDDEPPCVTADSDSDNNNGSDAECHFCHGNKGETQIQ